MDFDLTIKEGAGAFVCGEETALIHSIEGKRGMPRMRPSYPSESGLWGCPTNINNVETYCSVPSIILNGPGWFAGLGTARGGGTKAFALTGAIKNSGLVEVPIGMTLRQLIFDLGEGCKSARTFKAVQLGGPSGGRFWWKVDYHAYAYPRGIESYGQQPPPRRSAGATHPECDCDASLCPQAAQLCGRRHTGGH
jgi:NADH:ubiquinone oxidoreductase subunit F (NADH-binding)